MFCSHKFQTAVGQFLENKKEMVVLKCDKCGKYEVLSKLDMQQLRHIFVKSVNVSKISMYAPYVPCNATEFAARLAKKITEDSADNGYIFALDVLRVLEKIKIVAAEFGAEVE